MVGRLPPKGSPTEQSVYDSDNLTEREIMPVKKYWEDTYTYQRLMEILDDYWLTVEDEQTVEIDLYFKKETGETQMKHLRWTNPNL